MCLNTVTDRDGIGRGARSTSRGLPALSLAHSERTSRGRVTKRRRWARWPCGFTFGVAQLLAAAILVAGAHGQTSGGRAPKGPSNATASAHGKPVAVSAESHCVYRERPRAGYCRDTKALQRGDSVLEVTKGTTIKIRLGARAGSLRVWIARGPTDYGDCTQRRKFLPVERTGRRGRRWQATVKREPPTEGGVLCFRPSYKVWHGKVVFHVWVAPSGEEAA